MTCTLHTWWSVVSTFLLHALHDNVTCNSRKYWVAEAAAACRNQIPTLNVGQTCTRSKLYNGKYALFYLALPWRFFWGKQKRSAARQRTHMSYCSDINDPDFWCDVVKTNPHRWPCWYNVTIMCDTYAILHDPHHNELPPSTATMSVHRVKADTCYHQGKWRSQWEGEKIR